MSASTQTQQISKSAMSVLVVDDSLFMRTLMSDLLRSLPGVGAVATASSGAEAIRKIPHLRPDCILLDLMMPGMDGLVTLKMIMAAFPTPVIIVTGSDTGLASRCRAAGAISVIAKPSSGLPFNLEQIRHRVWDELKSIRRTQTQEPHHSVGKNRAHRRGDRIVVLGASTGGQLTLERILAQLTREVSIPLLVVQHAPDPFMTESFAERLNRFCELPVKVVEDNDKLHSGVAYLVPGRHNLFIQHESEDLKENGSSRRHHISMPNLRLQAMPEAVLTPSIDAAMQSAAAAYGSGVTGIILTGIGDDGLKGMRAIKMNGGRTIVQDQSAATYGMPGAVIKAGLADRVLSVENIARAIRGTMCR